MASLSVIVPTQGRETLARLMANVQTQAWAPGDEVIVVGDAYDATESLTWAQGLVQSAGCRWLTHDAGRHAWGHPQINHGMAVARGAYVGFMDDDDIFAPGAIAAIHAAIDASEVAPRLFKFVTPWGETLWQSRELVEGRIGGHCLVAPNIPGRLGTWTDRYAGDFDCIRETVGYWPAPVWVDRVIAVCRPAS